MGILSRLLSGVNLPCKKPYDCDTLFGNGLVSIIKLPHTFFHVQHVEPESGNGNGVLEWECGIIADIWDLEPE